MKKIVLLIIACLFLADLSAQNSQTKSLLPADYWKRIKPVPVWEKITSGNETILAPSPNRNYVSPNSQMRSLQTATEVMIGSTVYDLQTNGAIANRLLVHADGTISAVWLMIPTNGSASSSGTGYNYFDGLSWGFNPLQSIDTLRSSFPSIVVTSSDKEVCFSHGSASTIPGIRKTFRPLKGSGSWNYNYTISGFGADTWVRAISGGSNGQTIHLISGAILNGSAQNVPLYYSRSTDEGVTFPISRIIIPAIDSTHYRGFNGDSYSIDSKGDTVAIVVGSFTTDLVLLKSTDNGITWNSRILQTFPIPMYNPAIHSFGTTEAPSGDAHVMIDNNGLVHVFWSNVLVTDIGGIVGYYPNAIDGLLYWNENHSLGTIDVIASAQDKNANGILDIPVLSGVGMGTYRGSITQMPSSGVDENNNLFVAYQSFCEECDTVVYNSGHKHVYTILSNDNGQTWSCPLDMDLSVDMLNEECVYACMAKRVNSSGGLHIIYQRDAAPGTSLSSNPNESAWNLNPSDIIYTKITNGSAPLWTSGNCGYILSNKGEPFETLFLETHPNPATSETTISFAINEFANVQLVIKNVLDKTVYTENKGNLNAGKHSFQINTSQLADGIYFITLNTDAQQSTKKLVVSHF